MKTPDIDRRGFLIAAMAGAGGAVLASGCSRPVSRWRFFTEAEAAAVEAITEQIIPADEDAGAKDARVIDFIDTQLNGVFAQHQGTYRVGIAGVQQTSAALFGSPFELLDAARQVTVLKALEAGNAAGAVWETASSQAFFELVRNHTMQGFYGSPRHGGNRNFASFRMLGIAYPRIVGQNRYSVFPGRMDSPRK